MKTYKNLFYALIVIIIVIWICTPDESEKTVKEYDKKNEIDDTINWQNLANNLINDYQNKISSIEQLNSTTCWAVINPHFSNHEAVEIAENIGYYIKNSTGGIRGETPSIHVFKNKKHVAQAKYNGATYKGEIKIQDWSALSFNGKYKP